MIADGAGTGTSVGIDSVPAAISPEHKATTKRKLRSIARPDAVLPQARKGNARK